jgi:hypothetical protein
MLETHTELQWPKGQWRASGNDAKVRILLMAAGYYPLDDDDEEPAVRTTVRLPNSKHERVKYVADLWNALDKAAGKTRAKKWKSASVIERLVSVALDGFAAQIGGWPATAEQRKEMIRRAGEVMARLKK